MLNKIYKVYSGSFIIYILCKGTKIIFIKNGSSNRIAFFSKCRNDPLGSKVLISKSKLTEAKSAFKS